MDTPLVAPTHRSVGSIALQVARFLGRTVQIASVLLLQVFLATVRLIVRVIVFTAPLAIKVLGLTLGLLLAALLVVLSCFFNGSDRRRRRPPRWRVGALGRRPYR